MPNPIKIGLSPPVSVALKAVTRKAKAKIANKLTGKAIPSKSTYNRDYATIARRSTRYDPNLAISRKSETFARMGNSVIGRREQRQLIQAQKDHAKKMAGLGLVGVGMVTKALTDTNKKVKKEAAKKKTAKKKSSK